mmetsp:Transcript_2229/g.3249  ORF Transcript_2229/g.3249 Transcript_2229/m.3249 type:complete len:156 (-) Transcript_2229:760-1227(-)
MKHKVVKCKRWRVYVTKQLTAKLPSAMNVKSQMRINVEPHHFKFLNHHHHLAHYSNQHQCYIVMGKRERRRKDVIFCFGKVQLSRRNAGLIAACANGLWGGGIMVPMHHSGVTQAHFSIHDSRLQCTRTIPHVGSHSIAALHSTFSVPALQVRKR